jgi:deoxyhypusine synthase
MKRDHRVKKEIDETPDWLKKKRYPHKKQYLSGPRIFPPALTGRESLTHLIENDFLAYNSARLREGCRLFVEKMLEKDVLVGMSLAGALTPAGLGKAVVIPLMKAGFVDWIVATGANLYHDLHYAFNYPLHIGSPMVDDADLRRNDVVRIYDVLLGYTDCLMATDENLRKILRQPEFQKEMGTAELHHLLGRYAAEWEVKTGQKDVSVLAAAYRLGVPLYTSSPGDSTIGMNVAESEIRGAKLRINPSIDVNETTAIVLAAKRAGGKSAALLIGGGSPKNFMLQTEPQIQEVLRIKEVGHDYFFQMTDARPDTGGLSGATPHEAVSWGKINAKADKVMVEGDASLILPIMVCSLIERTVKKTSGFG